MIQPQHIIDELFAGELKNSSKLSGGDINEVFSVSTTSGDFVVKLNRADLFPQMLEKEAQGLKLLASAKAIRAVSVINYGQVENTQFLVLEKIETTKPSKKFWPVFGELLAKLHHTSSDAFGLAYNNYIGSLVQANTMCKTWPEFFITQRLQPMVEMAVNQGDINYVEAKIFDAFYKKVPDLFPAEKPALLHGDLWPGNYLAAAKDEPVLIDPAVYYGHREMDLGMMQLFGEFPPALFDAYHEIFPLETGWEERIPITQLYPLLVHVNLFGRGYWEKVLTRIEPFST